jgi:hypothetical protein
LRITISRFVIVGVLVFALLQPITVHAQVRYIDLGVTLIRLINESGSTIVPRLGEPFRILVVVTNSGNSSAANFNLDATATVSNSLQNFNFSESFGLFPVGTSRVGQVFGPVNVTIPGSTSTNLTVTASVNAKRTIPELNYSNNVLVESFPVGDLFPNANEMNAFSIRVISDQQTLTTKSGTYSNGVHVSMSSDGRVIALRSDAKHISVYQNGSRVFSANLTSSDLSDFQMSRNGRYLAVTTYDNFYVLNVTSLQGESITTAKDLAEVAMLSGSASDLQMSSFAAVGIADDGRLALGGSPSQGKVSSIFEIDIQFIQVLDWRTSAKLWTIDLFKRNAPWTQELLVQIGSLNFDRSDNLLVGLDLLLISVSGGSSLWPVAMYDRNPWLYMLDPSGSVIWRCLLNVPPSLVASNDQQILVESTQDGYARIISRSPTGSNTSLYIGTNSRSNEKPYESHIAVALAPEGDYYALADSANIYLMTTQSKPIFKFAFPYAISLALGGGYLAVGRVGGAEVFSLWDPVNKSIDEATSIINSAPASADMSQAKASLDSALSLRHQGLWYQSYQEALRTIALANSVIASAATQTLSTATSSSTISQSTFATSAQPLTLSSEMLIVSIVAVLVVLGVVVYVRARRKK